MTNSEISEQPTDKNSKKTTMVLNKVFPISLIIIGVILVLFGLVSGSFFNDSGSSENTVINLPDKNNETESKDNSNTSKDEKTTKEDSTDQNKSKDDNKVDIKVDKDPKTSSTSTSQPSGVGSSQNNANNNTQIKDDDIVETGHTVKGLAKSAKNALEIKMTGIWKATDYVQSDLSKDAQLYTVQLGDTLWEIAEAYFGSGFEWTKILNLNSSSIGFLPNGEQALIFPNQVLKLK